MLFDNSNDQRSLKDFYKKRRSDLFAVIREKYVGRPGSIFLFASFERDHVPFVQDSSFYYYTGVNEPGAVCEIDADGKSTLYLPCYDLSRAQWVSQVLVPGATTAKEYGFDACEPLGDLCKPFHIHPHVTVGTYAFLVASLEKKIKEGQFLFTLVSENSSVISDARCLLDRLYAECSELRQVVTDITPFVARQRRKKDRYEIEQLYKAVNVSCEAQAAAAMMCVVDTSELEVRAAAEYVFTTNGASVAFPTIVATEINATVLHSTPRHTRLKKGDLVTVDCGCMVEHYCADLTRTYPVSGVFSKRQRELYELVLAIQEHIVSIAKPGMWLSNVEKSEQSLNHIARVFLEEKMPGYSKYFNHGIGHFLGLDVHDVGDNKEPLEEGDVFTLEPGIYIPEERIGIRIEDDFWMVKDGVECLSYELPKTADEVQKLMQERD